MFRVRVQQREGQPSTKNVPIWAGLRVGLQEREGGGRGTAEHGVGGGAGEGRRQPNTKNTPT